MLPVNLEIFKSKLKDQKLPRLTKSKLKILEQSSILSVREKIELLLLLLHKKWIADIDVGLNNKRDSVALIEQLGLPWHAEHYDFDGQREQWIQVGINNAVLDYVKSRRNNLGDFEAGVLYGYPVTHVFGLVGIIQKRVARPSHVALFSLAGTYSRDFYDSEVEYFFAVWREIERISPQIASAAQQNYNVFLEESKSARSDK